MTTADWAGVVPSALLVLAWIVVPGATVLGVARVRGILLVGLAPAVSLALVWSGAILLGLVGVRWEPLTFGAVLLVVAAVVALLARRRRWGPVGGQAPYGATARGTALAVVAVVVLAGAAQILPVLVGGGPDLPVQRSDGMYHYNGAWLVLETGNASSLDAMDGMYGLRIAPGVGYPAVWHAVVTLVAHQESVVAVSNALLVVLPFVWLAGLAALGAAADPRRRQLAILAPALAVLLLIFPEQMVYGQGFWPNALALAVFPGVLAALVCTWTLVQHRAVGPGQFVRLGIASTAGLTGMAAAHPSSLFSLGWMTLPALVVLVVRLARRVRTHLSRRWRRVALVGFGVLAVSATVVLLTSRRVVGYLGSGSSADVGLGQWVVYLVTLWPPGGDALLAVGYVLVAASTATGLVVAVRTPRLRWLGAGWLLQTLLTAATYVPLGPLSSLSGLWYSSPVRIMVFTAPLVVVLMAVGADRWVSHAVRRAGRRPGAAEGSPAAADRPGAPTWAAVGAAVLVLCAVVTFPTRLETVTAHRLPGAEHVNALAGAEEMALWRRAAGKLPDGSVVLGDPANGSAYLQAIGQTAVAFAQVNPRAVDTDGNYLRENFDDVATDPQVCEIIEHYGVTHLYTDTDGRYDGEMRSDREPGLYGVDPADGLELVDEGGGAALYRITACGQRTAPPDDFFELGWRSDRTDPVVDDAP